ncbi:thermonuclease family protein [Agrobacterium sp. SHOUNA12C]|nr:thermonuclease family protein [Rhizobium rhizogenes]KAA6474505.1 nuclease [Agrobacterium sp. ICMP 7243]MCJ9723192.1 thermonuclease family protein [Agrobacterium sp. BETTINA12B]MCJ9758966.1 thermonuclease family protein [Agrobacterium sp. SHOUNA12C]NTF50297.1 nuclease [Rhizobium rhizogenes]NTF56930.1 nuclease [Rhizobium rhizogenes]
MEMFRTTTIDAAVVALLSITVTTPVDAQGGVANVSFSVNATYCENSACEPVTLRISSGDSLVMQRWGNHREQIRIANIDAPDGRARCIGERTSAEQATERLSQLLDGSSFTIARINTDHRGNSVAFVSINRRDVGHQLVRERLVWPWEPRHRS